MDRKGRLCRGTCDSMLIEFDTLWFNAVARKKTVFPFLDALVLRLEYLCTMCGNMPFFSNYNCSTTTQSIIVKVSWECCAIKITHLLLFRFWVQQWSVCICVRHSVYFYFTLCFSIGVWFGLSAGAVLPSLQHAKTGSSLYLDTLTPSPPSSPPPPLPLTACAQLTILPGCDVSVECSTCVLLQAAVPLGWILSLLVATHTQHMDTDTHMSYALFLLLIQLPSAHSYATRDSYFAA